MQLAPDVGPFKEGIYASCSMEEARGGDFLISFTKAFLYTISYT